MNALAIVTKELDSAIFIHRYNVGMAFEYATKGNRDKAQAHSDAADLDAQWIERVKALLARVELRDAVRKARALRDFIDHTSGQMTLDILF